MNAAGAVPAPSGVNPPDSMILATVTVLEPVPALWCATGDFTLRESVCTAMPLAAQPEHSPHGHDFHVDR